MNILKAAQILRPGTTWNLRGGILEQAAGETPVSIPTQDELQALVNADAYKDLRKNEYPPLTNLADALVHQQMGDGGAALTTYLNACIEVKNKYPKS